MKRDRDPDQAWFWTPEWQQREREADAEIRAGLISGPFRTVEELMSHLNDMTPEDDPPAKP